MCWAIIQNNTCDIAEIYFMIHRFSKYNISLQAMMLSVYMICWACSGHNHSEIADNLNTVSYEYHYRNLDSTMAYAQRAYDISDDYSDGKVEALNNMAFVYIAKMEYQKAANLLESILKSTDNQIEQLIADVQYMRLCQRKSENKNFYTFSQRAFSRIERIKEEQHTLTPHQNRRFVYAQSEYAIVSSIYFYYVGLNSSSVKAIERIDPNGEIVEDTAQLLNYYYTIGSGGIIKNQNTCQTEFNYLMRCYLLSRQYNYPYWEANSMQAISEHLLDTRNGGFLLRNNPQEIDFVNVDKVPDSLLAGNMAERSLRLFENYGDVYQTAGALRTIAQCHWAMGDYREALAFLHLALTKNKIVSNAPDLVASIREQLSLAYSAIGDKANSDISRRIYLDMQEKTRQDRQLEARAEQLDNNSKILNAMIVAVVVMIVFVILLLLLFHYMRHRNIRKYSITDLLYPLEEWKLKNDEQERRDKELFDELEEKKNMMSQQLLNNKQRNIEHSAKISLANSILPFINRIEHEINRLTKANEDDAVRHERYEYISELTDIINEYNNVLTRWIQMRQGDLNLKIESFPMQSLFDIVSGSRMEYQLRGITFNIEETTDIVKADKVLTLFMINTISENARRFTPDGGTVSLYSRHTDDYVEISIADTGSGIPKEKLKNIFSHKLNDTQRNDLNGDNDERKSYGFGLLNCKGIIDKYKKMSSFFNVCTIGVESIPGKGSRFFFRLPKGIVRLLVALFFCLSALDSTAAGDKFLNLAAQYSDSAHVSNEHGQYGQTFNYADSCIANLNKFYLSQNNTKHNNLMTLIAEDDRRPAELTWHSDSLDIDYDIILKLRNECAIAALAVHDWNLYHYNNNVYTQLFRKISADNTLSDYVNVMQKSESSKNVAIIMLVCLFIMIFPAYYFLYYRSRIYFNMCVDGIDSINKVLLSDVDVENKLKRVNELWKGKERLTELSNRFAPLSTVVNKIKQALEQTIARNSLRIADMEYMADDLKRVEYENDKMYICNNVLDNCLSTLKHETMYYPSRIRQLIDGTDNNLMAMKELVTYYKQLYTILILQANRQIECCNNVDNGTLTYMFEILKKLNAGKRYVYDITEPNERYVKVNVHLQSLTLDGTQYADLFTPLTCDVRFLICKQIVRDVGELTNARGCGIKAYEGIDKETIIEITLTKSIWKSLKLSL